MWNEDDEKLCSIYWVYWMENGNRFRADYELDQGHDKVV